MRSSLFRSFFDFTMLSKLDAFGETFGVTPALGGEPSVTISTPLRPPQTRPHQGYCEITKIYLIESEKIDISF